jgi:hypothetical protein
MDDVDTVLMARTVVEIETKDVAWPLGFADSSSIENNPHSQSRKNREQDA